MSGVFNEEMCSGATMTLALSTQWNLWVIAVPSHAQLLNGFIQTRKDDYYFYS